MAKTAPAKSAPRSTGYLIVSTHWDREWYEPFRHYQFRLVDVLDGALDLLEHDPDFKYFQADGQTVLLEDYLQIKPETRPRFEALARAGRFEVGPWYTMPDEFIPCGESLVRNLLVGHRIAADYGGAMKIGFVCDIFGHNSQLPQIFRGFGMDRAVVWRGTNFPKHPGLFHWQAADGSEVLAYTFESNGYGQYFCEVRMRNRRPDGTLRLKKAVEGIRRVFEIEEPRVPGRAILLFDGLDHTPTEPATSALVRRANEAGLKVVHATLAQYFDAVERQKLKLKTFCGELRDTAEKNGNVIPGVLASRIYLKQHNARCENRLLHWAEPIATLAALCGEPYPAGYLLLAWRYLLRNHAHDSICGCSIDQVHQDMMYRFDQCRLIADRVTHVGLRAVVDRMKLPELGENEDFAVTLFNPTPAPIDGVVDFPLYFPEDTKNRFQDWFGYEQIIGFRLHDSDGKEVAYQRLDVEKRVNVKTYDRRGGFHDRWCEQVRVAAPLCIPAFGWTTLLCRPTTDKTRSGGTQVLDDRTMQNEYLHLRINPNGAIDLTERASGRTYRDLLTFEEHADIGDGWYHGTAVNDEFFTSAGAAADIARVHDGFAFTTFRVRVVMNVPARFEHDKTMLRRSDELVPLVITSWLTLRAGARHVEVRTEVENAARDHRVRVLFPTGLAVDTYVADSPYDAITRNVALRPDWYQLHEPEVETKPQHYFTAVNDGERGLAIVSVGQPESAVRDLPDRPIALTLFRGFMRTVGTPGEPGGQMLGRTRHDYWICPHTGPLPVPELFRLGQRLAAGIQGVYTPPARRPLMQEKPDLPPTGAWLTPGPGPLVITAVKQAEGGQADGPAVIVRAFNPTDAPAEQSFEFFRRITDAFRADLLEQPVEPLAKRGRSVTITARPKEIVTIRVTLAP